MTVWRRYIQKDSPSSFAQPAPFMDDFSPTDSGLQNTFIKSALGFLGVVAGFKLLPKIVSFVARRFVFGFVSQLIFVILAGLLTKKAAETLTGRDAGTDYESADYGS